MSGAAATAGMCSAAPVTMATHTMMMLSSYPGHGCETESPEKLHNKWTKDAAKNPCRSDEESSVYRLYTRQGNILPWGGGGLKPPRQQF